MGNKKKRKKLQTEVEEDPITLYGKNMLEGTNEKYLGFFLPSSASKNISGRTLPKHLQQSERVHLIRSGGVYLIRSRVSFIPPALYGVRWFKELVLPTFHRPLSLPPPLGPAAIPCKASLQRPCNDPCNTLQRPRPSKDTAKDPCEDAAKTLQYPASSCKQPCNALQ